MNIDHNMSEIFDLPAPVEKVQGEIITTTGEVIAPPNERVETDYDKTRSNLYTLLQQGQDALNHALEVAKASEHPRAFEVVGNLMKQIADINAQLMDLHTKKKSLDTPTKAEVASGKQVTNNNAIFVGSTAELSKLIDNMNKG
jgi:Terminase DNA packaging enzyme